MKKKTIVMSFLLIVIVALVIPVAGFLFLLFFPLEPETKGKIFEAMKIIDLKKLPKGRFQKVSMIGGYEGRVFFEVPADKMAEFEANFRKRVQSATSSKGIEGCIPVAELRIQTDKGKYFAYIDYHDYGITIYRRSLFHRGFSSSELRKVFYDAGLKYSNEIKNNVNQP